MLLNLSILQHNYCLIISLTEQTVKIVTEKPTMCLTVNERIPSIFPII